MKLLNLLLSAAIFLTAFGVVQAQQTTIVKTTIFSVSDVKRTGDNTYTATVNTSGNATLGTQKLVIKPGYPVAITTAKCEHVPAKDSTAIIIVSVPVGASIQFSDGGVCSAPAVSVGTK